MKSVIVMRQAMKVIIACVLLLHGATAIANERDFDQLIGKDRTLPSWKFARGVTNVLGGPHEVFTYMTNYAILGSYDGAYQDGFYGSVSGALTGYVAGFFPGVYHMMKRMSGGCLEMLTFWRPEYGPVNGPTYGLRGLASGPSDYFDKEPYWYMGPSR